MSQKEKIVRFYLDQKGEKPVMDETFNMDKIVNVGETETITLWMKNITGENLDNIEIFTDDEELTIASFKTELGPEEIVPVKFSWSPTQERGRKALNSKIKVKARVIIKP